MKEHVGSKGSKNQRHQTKPDRIEELKYKKTAILKPFLVEASVIVQRAHCYQSDQ